MIALQVGTLNISGGSLSNRGQFTVDSGLVDFTFGHLFNNGSLGTASFTLSGGTLVNRGTVVASNSSYTSGSLSGDGRLLLTGFNTIDFDVSQGTIQILDSSMLSSQKTLDPLVVIDSEGLLEGLGTFSNLSSSGTVVFGASPSLLATIQVNCTADVLAGSDLVMTFIGYYYDQMTGDHGDFSPSSTININHLPL